MNTQNKKSFITYIGIVAAILVIFNVVSRNWFFRLDLTENKMYSLSESSKSVVSKIDDRLTMKVYFSDNLPGEYGNNRRYLQDILEEYAAYSRGYIHFEFYPPDNDKKMQDGVTSTMVYGVNFLVSYLSHFMSLQPGDIISTGTPPGVGMGMKSPVYLKPGDKMKLGIEGLGEQNQKTISY